MKWFIGVLFGLLTLTAAASPVARNCLARALIVLPLTCGIRAAGVPGRGE